MTTVYRLLRSLYAANPFDGEGAYRYGGRWSSVGTRVVYTSQYQSLAMLEYFVHLDRDDPPTDLVLARARIPDRLSRTQVALESFRPTGVPVRRHRPWPRSATTSSAQRKAAILIVPSALAPSESNWLLNPLHPEFGRIEIQSVESFEYDERLFA